MIRSLIFKFFFTLGLVSVCLIFLPAFVLPRKVALFGGKLLGYWSEICLNLFLSCKIEVLGKENIINNDKFFIACSHQSMFETFFLQTVFNSPIFILKKELIKIPVFGWYLKKIGSITIDRNKISKENLGFSEKIILAVKNSDRPIIIFPQGTRVDENYRGAFKKGASRIYETLKIKCQPVAINSGTVWPKHGNLIPNKKIVVSILKPIEANLNGTEFLKILENNIYSELDKF